MKHIIYTLGILAASALLFSACQTDLNSVSNQAEVNLVTISFTADKVSTDTKTQANEGVSSVSYEWTDEDVANIKLFTVDGGGALEAEVASPTITKVSPTSLTISTTVLENSTTTFRAILCKATNYTGSGDDYTSRKPKIPDTQTPNGITNYDPNADVLVSDDLVVTVGTGVTTTGTMNMVFRRKVVINKMTLKNMEAGEKVSRVIITSDKKLTGFLQDGVMNGTGQKNTITVNYDDVAVPAGGEFPVYFVTMPNNGQTLNVEVTTDKYIYSKAFGSTIDLNLGSFTRFGVSLPAGVANTTLSVPINDSMAWANNGASDSTTELTAGDLTPTQGEKKIYATSTKAYKGIGALKLGTSSLTGSITTNDIDLSSAFFVAIDAKVYSTDASKIKILVDGVEAYTSSDALTSSFKTYYVNCAAATDKSTVTIASVSGSKPRAYIKNLFIGAGEYVAPHAISYSPEEDILMGGASGSTKTVTVTSNYAWSATFSVPANWGDKFDIYLNDSSDEANKIDPAGGLAGAAGSTLLVFKSKQDGNGDGSTITSFGTVTFTDSVDPTTKTGSVNIQQSPKSGLDPVAMNIYSNAATVTGSGASQTATWTSGDITVTAIRNDNGNTAFRSSDTNHTRFYPGWTITVSSASNTISSVEFTCTSNAYATTLEGQTFTAGTASASSTTVTVSGVSASSTSVTLGSQVRVSSITVNY